MKKNRFNYEAMTLLRGILVYSEYALEQIEQGATVTAETLQEIRHAKKQIGAALLSLLNDNHEKD